jgi:hypothetical protein
MTARDPRAVKGRPDRAERREPRSGALDGAWDRAILKTQGGGA